MIDRLSWRVRGGWPRQEDACPPMHTVALGGARRELARRGARVHGHPRVLAPPQERRAIDRHRGPRIGRQLSQQCHAELPLSAMSRTGGGSPGAAPPGERGPRGCTRTRASLPKTLKSVGVRLDHSKRPRSNAVPVLAVSNVIPNRRASSLLHGNPLEPTPLAQRGELLVGEAKDHGHGNDGIGVIPRASLCPPRVWDARLPSRTPSTSAYHGAAKRGSRCCSAPITPGHGGARRITRRRARKDAAHSAT
jgi:hypothetical protein